jgi:serine/threonine protein phosphatase 1
MNTYVIGDIHGGLKALQQVLPIANLQETDTFIFLGDYVDGWSESAQVIDFLIDFEEKHNAIFIKGNHDVYCLQWLTGYKLDLNWIKHGGKATIKSYANINTETKLKHIHFLERLKNYYVDENNNLFIHAGFTSMHGPEKEFHESMHTWDRTLWEMALTMDKRIKKNSVYFPRRLLLFNEIFIGHTPTINYNSEVPMEGCNVWNVDTGAAFNGKLSMLNVETKQFIQSENVYKLYPNENGRNK